jgi:heat shock protein HtpX
MNIYQNIDANKRDSWLIILGFVAVVTFIGWFVGQVFFQDSGYFFVGLALVVAGVSSFVSYYNSDKIVLSVSHAREVTPQEAPDLHNLVENMSIASGLPKPKVYLIDDPAMNAFATGRDPNHSVICYTTGIVQKLEKRELEGVTAHEMSHIGNYDIRLMSLVSVLVGSVTLLADMFTRGIFYGGGRRRGRSSGGDLGGLLFIFGIIFVILSPVVAALIKLALSRHREYLADANGALITRYPQGLANALRKLASDTDILHEANGATAHLYIVSPLRATVSGFVANMFNTHPPIEERIRRLEAM